ncbi:hypothetical protein N7495_003546 [Penicillium taxi]|uniref:uncharacterized protein n=1 Tax=Penicillium taxi TaxID=168475 RepID=UPI0025451F69|nr:uncharacterized protein N7495_003546 [Penicillium taxi]KAJ5898802.1 hypothetical protein N7495_003546 [Penicillium taxi]
MAEAEQDFSSLPLPDRFTHKNWKVRKEGYEDAKAQFEKTPDEDHPVFAPFLQDSNLWKGAVADSNVAAQVEGLASYCSFLKFGGVQACIKTRSLTIGPIAEKGLPCARPAGKASAQEALLLCVELDKATPVLEDLIPVTTHKVPKVVAATLSTLTLIYHNFGCKIVDPKPTLKALPKVFGHADKNVRAEAQNLTVELYRWLREAIKPLFWADLKPMQQADLEKLFEAVKQEPTPKQERFTRVQQDAMAEASNAPVAEEGEEGGEEFDEEEEEAEVIDLAEPVDIMPKVPKDLHDNLGSSKWKDRKEALDALYNVLNVPRIKEGPFDEIVRALAKCMKDANVAVVTVAANCVDLLARGLRLSFAKYRSTIMVPILERLKEKKQSVADALGHALDAVFLSTDLSDCLEDIFEFLKHKNPQVKQETLKFLIRCLRTTRVVPSKPEVKSIAEAGTKLLTESTEVVRSGGAEVLGTLMKIMGERAMNPYLDGLDEIRKTRIKEFFETAEVKAKDRPKPIVAPPKPAAPAVKKAVPGKKPALGLKKATPAAAAAAPPESPTKPTPRAALSKLGGAPKSVAPPAAGMRLKSKLGGPGGLASPQRRVASPPSEELAPPPAAPKLGLGRGLAGRPIAKPSAYAEAPPAPAAPAVNAISAAERAELEELRVAEKESFTRTIEEMKSDRSRLNSQITELQNQNAQLIEDHTRDVLSIKAKETQLVRARSDAEAAEQNVQKQQREIERLKRELARALRASATSPSNDMSEGSESASIYHEPIIGAVPPRSGPGLQIGSRFDNSRSRSFASASPSEEKENGGLASPGLSRRKLSPTYNNFQSALASPTRSRASINPSDEDQLRQPEPWKRAAEVTSALKARIEEMKLKQGISSRQPAQRQ